MFTVITENDVSQWNDNTGVLYHFPNQYRHHLQPGCKVIYYKGRIRDNAYASVRLSNEPHYFGTGEIGKVYNDTASTRNDLYAEIINYQTFTKAVPFKIDNEYLEVIPDILAKNYWRNGVKPI